MQARHPSNMLLALIVLAVLACTTGWTGEVKDYRPKTDQAISDHAKLLSAENEANGVALTKAWTLLDLLVKKNTPQNQLDAALAEAKTKKAKADTAAKARKDHEANLPKKEAAAVAVEPAVELEKAKPK